LLQGCTDVRYFGDVRQHFRSGGADLTVLAYPSLAHIPEHHCRGFFMPLGAAFVEGWTSATQRLEPGDVSYHPAEEAYWLRSSGTSAGGVALDIDDAWCRTHGVEPGWEDAPRDLSRTRVSWLMARLFLEVVLHEPASPLVVEGLSLEICAELTAMRGRLERHRPPWLVKVQDLLRARMRTSVTLADLSATAGVSAVSVIKAFRRHEGMTPGEYVRLARLVEARRALFSTDRSLSAIASHTGFYDQSHFSHAFSGAVGASPAVYRHLLRGGSRT
jgi:AraC family transcriptional regulator